MMVKDIAKCVDLTGRTFGRLKVLEIIPTDTRKTYWLCQCSCGNMVRARSDMLQSGNTSSCGCLKKEQDEKNLVHKSHGQYKARLYHIWQGVKARCENQNTDSWARYGGRGITVCIEWRDSFEAFQEWALSNGYTDDLTIERKDNMGNYEPSNCTWTTNTEQCNNRRSNIKIEYDGKTYTLLRLCKVLGLDYGAINARYNRGDRGDELLRPTGERVKPQRGEINHKCKITEETAKAIKQALVDGQKQAEIARKYGISKYLVHDIKRGKTWAWL